MKKIIHLSDLHVGYSDCSAKFRAIIDNITFLKQPAKNYIVLITGDIVDNANHSEFIDEAPDAIKQLEERGYNVLVVPGNHDYGTGVRGDKKFVDLFGHYHADPVSAGKIFHGVWGIPRCYNAGSSTHKNGDIGFQRIIDLSKADPRMDYDGNFI